MANITSQEYILKSFLSNVNKLTPGKSTFDKYFGRVTCIKEADHTRAYNKHINRTGYGTRKFSVAKSTLIPSGKYTLGTIRRELSDAIHEDIYI